MKINIGLQIYTVREELSLGYDEVFRKVAEAGYKGVELPYAPEHGAEIKELLAKHSLEAVGSHISAEDIESNLEEVKSFADFIGSKIIIIPWIGGDSVESYEKTKETAKRFEAIAQKLSAMGYELAFHNHRLEFERKFDGKTVMDIFFEEAPTLKFQIDAGWAYAAGADVCAFLNKFAERLISIHIKDVDENDTPTEIGSGKVDMKSVIDTAAGLGVKWGVVEQDNCINYKPFESIKVSYNYLKTIH